MKEKHQIIEIGGLLGCTRCQQGDSYVRENPFCTPTIPTSTEGPAKKRLDDGMNAIQDNLELSSHAPLVVPALEVEEKSCGHGNMKGCLGCYKPEHKTVEEPTEEELDKAIELVKEERCPHGVHGTDCNICFHSEHKTWEETFIEAGAKLEHARWARWQNHVHNQCSVNQFGDWILPPEVRERWQRQINAPYSELSEAEKESDRREVREYLPLIAGLLAHAKEEGDFKNGICMHCDRCGRKKVPLGRVLEYGKFYPSVTRKFADGHTEETPATNEIKKALCIPCSKETWSSFEKGRADAQRETVAAAIEIIQKADGAFPIEDFPASRFGHQLLKEITTELRSLAPTPEQSPKEI